MKMNDQANFHGKLTLILVKADGQVEVTHKDNIIVNVGFDLICNAIGATTSRPGIISHIGVGTGAIPPAVGDTNLGASVLRKTAAYAHTAGTKVFTMTSVFNPGEATSAISEAGVFNAVSAGIMLDRVIFPVVNKGADDTLTTIFTFTLS